MYVVISHYLKKERIGKKCRQKPTSLNRLTENVAILIRDNHHIAYINSKACTLSLATLVYCLSHEWKFNRNVATTGGHAKSHAWTSDNVVCWLFTCRLIHPNNFKMTFLIIANISALRMICLSRQAWIYPNNDKQPQIRIVHTLKGSLHFLFFLVFCRLHTK